MKNFHVPLPDDIYDHLRISAERSNVPATVIAREAIDQWLRLEKRKARHDTIAAYAAEMGSTPFDLDPDLEAAAVDHLVKPARKSK